MVLLDAVVVNEIALELPRKCEAVLEVLLLHREDGLEVLLGLRCSRHRVGARVASIILHRDRREVI